MSETRIVSVRVMDSDQAIEELLAEKNGLIATQAAQIEALRKALKTARTQLLGWMIPDVGPEAATRHVAYIDAALAAVGEKKP